MIVASAIRFFYISDIQYKYPQIWTGHRHPDILEKMFGMRVLYDKTTAVQGFLTDDNRFLNRYEAKEYAIKCGQLTPEEIKYAELYSEDLWPE